MPMRRGISWPGLAPGNDTTFCMWFRLRVNSMQTIEKNIQKRLNADSAMYQFVSLVSMLVDLLSILLSAVVFLRDLLSFSQSSL